MAFVCSKYRLEDQIEEVHQLVCTKLVDSLKNSTAVYGLVKVLAGRRCIDLIRSRIAKPEYSYDAIIEKLGESAHFVVDDMNPTLGDHATNVGRAIDTQKAVEKFNDRLSKSFARYEAVADLYLPPEAMYSDQDLIESPPRGAISKPVPKKRKPLKRASQKKLIAVKEVKQVKPVVKASTAQKLSAAEEQALKKIMQQHASDAQEITDLRTALNFTNYQMAVALDITEAMFGYTLYTRDRPIKPELMEKVRELRQSVTAERLMVQSSLAGSDARELITKWMKKLRIPPQSKTANQEFGDFVGASRSTVWRWRNGDLTPKPGKLLEIQKMVDEKVLERKARRGTKIAV